MYAHPPRSGPLFQTKRPIARYCFENKPKTVTAFKINRPSPGLLHMCVICFQYCQMFYKMYL